MAKFRPNAAALIMNNNGEILICERINDKGAWQFPQGGVDKNETMLEALKREVMEEVGIPSEDYAIEDRKDDYYYFYPPRIRAKKKWDGQQQSYFLCSLKETFKKVDLGKKKKAEFSDYKWIKPEEFNVHWLPGFKVEVYREVMLDFFNVEI